MAEHNISSAGNCIVSDCYVDIKDIISEDELVNFDVFYWLCTAFVLIHGTAITAAIVHYERYAEDPQKRSLANRFVSKAAISCLVCALCIISFVGLLRYK